MIGKKSNPSDLMSVPLSVLELAYFPLNETLQIFKMAGKVESVVVVGGGIIGLSTALQVVVDVVNGVVAVVVAVVVVKGVIIGLSTALQVLVVVVVVGGGIIGLNHSTGCS